MRGARTKSLNTSAVDRRLGKAPWMLPLQHLGHSLIKTQPRPPEHCGALSCSQSRVELMLVTAARQELASGSMPC